MMDVAYLSCRFIMGQQIRFVTVWVWFDDRMCCDTIWLITRPELPTSVKALSRLRHGDMGTTSLRILKLNVRLRLFWPSIWMPTNYLSISVHQQTRSQLSHPRILECLQARFAMHVSHCESSVTICNRWLWRSLPAFTRVPDAIKDLHPKAWGTTPYLYPTSGTE